MIFDKIGNRLLEKGFDTNNFIFVISSIWNSDNIYTLLKLQI